MSDVATKPAFDPNQPWEPVAEPSASAAAKPKFDPNQPWEPADGSKNQSTGIMQDIGDALYGANKWTDDVAKSAKGAVGSALANAAKWISDKEQQYGGGTGGRKALDDVLNEGKSLGDAAKDFTGYYGKKPDAAPSGKEIAGKQGYSTEPLSKSIPWAFTSDDPAEKNTVLRAKAAKGGLLDVSPAGLMGGAYDILTDPVQVLAGPISKGLGAVGKSIGAVENKALNVLTDLKESAAQLYKENPQAVENAMSKPDLANKIADTFKFLKEDSAPAYGEAMSSLSSDRLPKPGFELPKALDMLEKVKSPETEELASQLVRDHSQRTMSGLTPAVEHNYLTETEMHRVKDTLKDLADWESTIPNKEKVFANIESGKANALLKSANPKYADAMDDVASHLQMQQDLSKKFGIEVKYNPVTRAREFIPTDKTLTAIDDVARGKRIDRANILETLKNGHYGDLAKDIQLTAAKAALEGGSTNGSRKAVVGYTLGEELGDASGMPGGRFVGKALGAGAGAVLDKYGHQIGKGVLNVTQPLQSAIEGVTPEMVRAGVIGPKAIGSQSNAVKRRMKNTNR